MEFRLPDLGENIEAATVLRVAVASGDTVAEGQTVLELETDKATVEVPAPVGGRVEHVGVEEGAQVRSGAVLMVIAEDGQGNGGPPTAQPFVAPMASKPGSGLPAEPEVSAPTPPQLAASPPAALGARALASAATGRAPSPDLPVAEGDGQAAVPAGPLTRRLAREMGVDLRQVPGTARGGRVTAEDVRSYVRHQLGGAVSAGRAVEPTLPPLPDFSQWGETERRPLTGIRRAIAENLSLAWHLCPQVTQYEQADITELDAGRKRVAEGQPASAPKMTITVLLIKAVVAGLKEYPLFNASLDMATNEWVLKKYMHFGVAVDTEHGLLVPVIRDADRKTVPELAVEVARLAERARQRKLSADEMRGGSFTITNLGVIGGTAFSPIVNYPEVAILGVARSSWQQVVRDGKAEIRLMLPLCLTYDHRAIDGADGARLAAYLARLLSDPVRLLMES